MLLYVLETCRCVEHFTYHRPILPTYFRTVVERDRITIERCNLQTVVRYVIKELIDSSLKYGRMIDDEHVPLQQFFVVLEHILQHGVKREWSLSMLISETLYMYYKIPFRPSI